MSTIAVSAIVVVAATILAGQAGSGFDATWALVWARNLLHAHVAAIPAHAFSVTPHPAALGIGAVAVLVAPAHAMTAWAVLTELTVAAAFAGVVRLGGTCGSYPAGWLAAIAIAVEPGVRDGIGRGTTDILCAAGCVWAVAVVVRYPSLGLCLAAVASLCRPEAWLLLIAISAIRWPQLRSSERLTAAISAALVPAVWIVMGATMFGDPLAAVHVTVANDQGPKVGNTSFIHMVLHLPGWLGPLAVVGVVVAAANVRERPQLALTLAATAALTAGLLVEVAGGASFVARYSTPIVALLFPLAIAALLRLRWPRARLAATVGIAAVVASAFVSTRTARLGDNNKFAAQRHAVNSLLDVVDTPEARTCTAIAIPQTALIPVIALALPERTHIDVADTSAAAQRCTLFAQNLDALNANEWGPATIGQSPTPHLAGAHVVARNDRWALYEN